MSEVARLDRNLSSMPSVNIYASEQILKARLLAAATFEMAFRDYSIEDRASKNVVSFGADLLDKSRDALGEYGFLGAMAEKAYNSAIAANDQAQRRYQVGRKFEPIAPSSI